MTWISKLTRKQRKEEKKQANEFDVLGSTPICQASITSIVSKIFCCLKMNSVVNILRYLRGQFLGSSRSDTRDGNSMAQKDLMEELSQKFPQLANDIFDSLDDQSLANCQRVNRSWANYLGSQQRFRAKIMRFKLLMRKPERSYGEICADFICVVYLQCWGMRQCDGDYTI